MNYSDNSHWINIAYSEPTLDIENGLVISNRIPHSVCIREYSDAEYITDYFRPFINDKRLRPVVVMQDNTQYLVYPRDVLNYNDDIDFTNIDMQELHNTLRHRRIESILLDILNICDPRIAHNVISIAEQHLNNAFEERQNMNYTQQWFEHTSQDEEDTLEPETPRPDVVVRDNMYFELVQTLEYLNSDNTYKSRKVRALRQWSHILGIHPLDVSWKRINTRDKSNFMKSKCILPSESELRDLLKDTYSQDWQSILDSYMTSMNARHEVRRYEVYNGPFIYCTNKLQLLGDPDELALTKVKRIWRSINLDGSNRQIYGYRLNSSLYRLLDELPESDLCREYKQKIQSKS